VRKSINLAAIVAATEDHQSQAMTLAELLRAFVLANPAEDEYRLKKWVEAFGRISAWELKTETLEDAANGMLEHGYKPGTVNRDLSTIGSAYRWAKEKRLSPRGFRSPTLGVRRFNEPVRRVHIEQETVDRLIELAKGYRDRRFAVFVSLLADTGCRKSEILERRWRDVDLDQREIFAPVTKNGTPRILFFTEGTKSLIERVYTKRPQDQLLFESTKCPGQYINYRASWREITELAGVRGLRMHDIRHAAAARLLRAGVTLGVAAQVLGHDPSMLAKRYGHLQTRDLKQAQLQAWSHVA
jgi:integrase